MLRRDDNDILSSSSSSKQRNTNGTITTVSQSVSQYCRFSSLFFVLWCGVYRPTVVTLRCLLIACAKPKKTHTYTYTHTPPVRWKPAGTNNMRASMIRYQWFEERHVVVGVCQTARQNVASRRGNICHGIRRLTTIGACAHASNKVGPNTPPKTATLSSSQFRLVSFRCKHTFVRMNDDHNHHHHDNNHNNNNSSERPWSDVSKKRRRGRPLLGRTQWEQIMAQLQPESSSSNHPDVSGWSRRYESEWAAAAAVCIHLAREAANKRSCSSYSAGVNRRLFFLRDDDDDDDGCEEDAVVVASVAVVVASSAR